MLTLW